MSFQVNGVDISRGLVVVPRYGIGHAEVVGASDWILTIGSQVPVVLGDLTLTMTVADGDAFGAESRWTLVAGYGGWSTTVGAKAYRSDSGILLSTTLQDLATTCGELVNVTADRVVGYAWTRMQGLASVALEELVGSEWYIDPGGVTQIGPRPASSISPLDVVVERYEPSIRRATVSLNDDSYTQLLPGATLSSPALNTPFTIASTTYRIEDSSIQVGLVGEKPPSELFADLLRAFRPRLREWYPYQVQSDATGSPVLRPFGQQSSTLPDLLYIHKIPGLPGGTSTLPAEAVVLIGFQGGDPGSPFVAAYVSGTPTLVALDATAIRMGGGAAGPVSLAAKTDAAIATLTTAINAILSASGKPSIPTPPSTASTKLSAE